MDRRQESEEDDAELDLVAAAGVVELVQGSQVAVWHVGAAAEENQSAGAAGEGSPEHLDAILLLGTKTEVRESQRWSEDAAT